MKTAFKDKFMSDNVFNEDFIRKEAPIHVQKVIKGSALSEEEWNLLKVSRIIVISQKSIF